MRRESAFGSAPTLGGGRSIFRARFSMRTSTPLNLRRLPCALGMHRYLYGGVLLGQRLERCRHCNKVRTTRRPPHPRRSA